MQIEQDVLINELLALTDKAIESTRQFKTLRESDLNYKKNPNEWSILECMEHLNLYGDFYLPEIEKQLLKSKPAGKTLVFKSGFIGNYFANLMKVDSNGKIKKMKSPKDKDPLHSKLSVTTIDRQLKQLEKLKVLLHQSRAVDLTKLKAAISLTRLVKLRLGDTFRFLIYHIERHILQAQRNLLT